MTLHEKWSNVIAHAHAFEKERKGEDLQPRVVWCGNPDDVETNR